MEFRIFDGGKRVIGFQRPDVTDRIELEAPSEPVEPELGYDMGELGENIVPTMPDEIDRLLKRQASGAVTAAKLVQAVHDLWVLCRALAREVGITVPELLKLVGMCDKENRRRGQAKRRLEVRAADMVE